MSYCRFAADCDVYVYAATDGGVVCCACSLRGATSPRFTRPAMLTHLASHQAHGHRVPRSVFARLRTEIREGFHWGERDRDANERNPLEIPARATRCGGPSYHDDDDDARELPDDAPPQWART